MNAENQCPVSTTYSVKLGLNIVFFAFVLVCYLSQPTTDAGAFPQVSGTKNPLQPTEKNMALGLDHFSAHCASCHGDMGKADTEMGKAVGATDLTSQQTQAKSDAELFRIISKGVPGTAMQAFGKTHQPAEIWHTILFLRKLPTLTAEEKQKLEAAIPASAPHKHGDKKEAGHEHHEQPPTPEDTEKKPRAHPNQPPVEHQHEEETTLHRHDESEAQHEPEHKPPEEPMTQEPSAQEHEPMAGHQPHRPPPQPPAPEAQQPPQPHTMPDQHAGHQMPSGGTQQGVSADRVLTLTEIEQMAMQNNPTLAQAEAAIRAAQGRRRQAGLWPNPIVGYQGEEFAFRAFSQKSEHFFFVEQTIPLGGKLRKSQRIFEQEAIQAEAEAEAQKQRVLNTVRMLYYEALGAQHLVDLRTELAKVARDAVKTTTELLNVGQADRPDHLEAEIEAQQAELELESAENARQEVWQLLAAVVGSPSMEPARLAGNLEEELPALDPATMLATLLRDSPEIQSARAGVERAQAVLARARAERIPDLFLRGGIGYSTETLELRNGRPGNRTTGPEASVQAGLTLPIFNRNQGAIAAAQAELAIAERELQRLELALRSRLASVFMRYNTAWRTVQRYRQNVLPRARRAYELYLASFKQMAAAYPQVLISQRTMFQVQDDYVNTLVELRQSAIQIQGFLLTGGLSAPRVRPFEIGGGEETNLVPLVPGVFHVREPADGREGRQP